MYDGIRLIMSSSMRTCAENCGKHKFGAEGSKLSLAIVLIKLTCTGPGIIASLLHSTSRISPSLSTFITLRLASMVSLLPDSYLSQVAVLAHHFLLLLGERQVVEEPVPHHLQGNFQLGVCSSRINPTTLTGWRSLSAKSAAAAKAPLASYFGFTDCFTLNKL